jgi:hypothetical protein
MGNCDAASDRQWLESARITTIINCTAKGQIHNFFEAEPGCPFTYLRVSLSDAVEESLSSVFQLVADTLLDVARQRRRVLIHCTAGRSRWGRFS